MDEKKINEITTKIIEKLGDDNSALILDDIGMLLTENNKSLQEIKSLKEEKTNLENRYKSVVEVNGKLLQQIPVGFDKQEDNDNSEEKKREPFYFKNMFDSKGNFKHNI